MTKIKIPDPSEASANDHDFKIYSHGKLVKRASERITATELSELAVMAA